MAASSTVRSSGEERRGERGETRTAGPPPALRLWTSMVGGGACEAATARAGTQCMQGGGGGKVAAEADCNWFILINDDLLCGSSKNGNSGTVFLCLFRPPPD